MINPNVKAHNTTFLCAGGLTPSYLDHPRWEKQPIQKLVDLIVGRKESDVSMLHTAHVTRQKEDGVEGGSLRWRNRSKK